MARRDLVTGLVIGAFGIAYVVLSARLPPSGATRTQLGPHVYPLMIGCLLLLAVAVLLVTAGVRRRRAGPDTTAERGDAVVADAGHADAGHADAGHSDAGHSDAGGQETRAGPTRWGWLAAVFVATCAYVWLLGFLGFVITTTLFLGVCMYLVDGRRRYRGVRAVAVPGVYGLATAVAIYIAFGQLLGVLLPPGLLVPALLG